MINALVRLCNAVGRWRGKNVLVDQFLQINANLTESTDGHVDTNAFVSGNISIGLRNTEIAGVVAHVLRTLPKHMLDKCRTGGRKWKGIFGVSQ